MKWIQTYCLCDKDTRCSCLHRDAMDRGCNDPHDVLPRLAFSPNSRPKSGCASFLFAPAICFPQTLSTTRRNSLVPADKSSMVNSTTLDGGRCKPLGIGHTTIIPSGRWTIDGPWSTRSARIRIRGSLNSISSGHLPLWTQLPQPRARLPRLRGSEPRLARVLIF